MEYSKVKLRKDTKLKDKLKKNLRISLKSIQFSMKLISDEINKNNKLMHEYAIVKGKELRKIKKEFKSKKLVNYRPIVPLIRVFWESFINLYNFDKFDKDYVGFIKLKQMFNIYNHLKDINENSDSNKKDKNENSDSNKKEWLFEVLEVMFSEKEISKWKKNELLQNLLDEYKNELFTTETLGKLKKGEKINKELYNKLKKIFRNSYIIKISEFDSSIQINLKNIYSKTSSYIHLANISCVVKDKVKVKEIIKDHNKLCKCLSEYLKSYNLNIEDLNIEDEYIEDEYIEDEYIEDLNIEDEYIEDEYIEDEYIEDLNIEDEYIRNIICREDIKDEYIDYVIDTEDEEVENDYYM